jgi:opacity protein-like surface antigen
MPARLLPLLLLISLSASAQDWSVGVGTGPFVFGDFVERTLRLGTEVGTARQTTRLSAATRAGVAVDLQRQFSDRLALRLEGTFVKAPLAIKGDDDDGVSLDAGELDVATFMLPLVYTINRRGSFRFHILAGPAYASYRITRDEDDSSAISVFTDTRTNWGAALGAGVAWQWSRTFAVEGAITDVSTSSPFQESDFSAATRVNLPRPHNVHTTVGLRYRF